MRVTQSMIANNSLRHLSNTYGRLGQLQEQMNTGKKITRPSDDPVSAMKGIAYRNNVLQTEQFKRNFSEAHNWIDNTDAALDQATKAMHRIRDLAVKASNGTYEEGQLDAITKEINEIMHQLENIANTEVGGKYIFNGTKTNERPVDLAADPPVFPTSTDDVKIELGKGVLIPVNMKPETVFSEGFFESIQNLINDIESEGDVGSHLSVLDERIDEMLKERASLGAKSNRIDLMEQRVDQQEEISKKMMSDNEDVEYEKVITEFIMEESLLRASLSVSSRIVQPTLIDFLR
ncbi:MAG TPA: flagellar hook-associated protein FlgL [Bacillus bacterium]|uniref:Flagellar hook-associated protein 3 n=1 Tax=Siminovitchia fordii TaxID=254759 RepID=A0ABQ4K1J0_9BACI|nr:flagellar hook-associated protein FlgL [Siminovitchia fordii]GIN19615.1 flagellar hook-associated protein 3 [Siminovitchia fordii]HBZ11477.1 flagellar hook-associated protein FlgL [Bacillus sp. (in: firmicutes)]